MEPADPHITAVDEHAITELLRADPSAAADGRINLETATTTIPQTLLAYAGGTLFNTHPDIFTTLARTHPAIAAHYWPHQALNSTAADTVVSWALDGCSWVGPADITPAFVAAAVISHPDIVADMLTRARTITANDYDPVPPWAVHPSTAAVLAETHRDDLTALLTAALTVDRHDNTYILNDIGALAGTLTPHATAAALPTPVSTPEVLTAEQTAAISALAADPGTTSTVIDRELLFTGDGRIWAGPATTLGPYETQTHQPIAPGHILELDPSAVAAAFPTRWVAWDSGTDAFTAVLRDAIIHPGDPAAGPDMVSLLAHNPELCVDGEVWTIASHLCPDRLLAAAGGALFETAPDKFTTLARTHPNAAASFWPRHALASDAADSVLSWADRHQRINLPPAFVAAAAWSHPDRVAQWISGPDRAISSRRDRYTPTGPEEENLVRPWQTGDWPVTSPSRYEAALGNTPPEWMFHPSVACTLATTHPEKFTAALRADIYNHTYIVVEESDRKGREYDALNPNPHNGQPASLRTCPDIATQLAPDAVAAWAETQLDHWGRITGHAERKTAKTHLRAARHPTPAVALAAARLAGRFNTSIDVYASALADPFNSPISLRMLDPGHGYTERVTAILAKLMADDAIAGSVTGGVSIASWTPDTITRLEGYADELDTVTAAMLAGYAAEDTTGIDPATATPTELATHLRVVVSEVARAAALGTVEVATADAWLAKANTTLRVFAHTGDGIGDTQAERWLAAVRADYNAMVGGALVTGAPELAPTVAAAAMAAAANPKVMLRGRTALATATAIER